MKKRKALVSFLIKEIQIYTRDEAEVPLKSISFNFPVYKDGQEVQELLWDKGNTVESIILMTKCGLDSEKQGFTTRCGGLRAILGQKSGWKMTAFAP